MAGRFSQIKYLIKKGTEMGINVAEDDNIKAYRNYRRGTSEEYKTTAVKRGGSQPVSLIPFFALSVQFRCLYKMSGRAFAAMAQNGVTEAKLNIDSGAQTQGKSGEGGQKVTGFIAAKMHLFVGTGSITTPKSGILLLEYKKRGGTSYTYPFGKNEPVDESTYVHMTGKLTKEFSTGNRSVSFKPERSA